MLTVCACLKQHQSYTYMCTHFLRKNTVIDNAFLFAVIYSFENVSGKMDFLLINNLIGLNKTTASSRLSEWSNSQKNITSLEFFSCISCGRVYRSKTALSLHVRVECGKEPQRQCVFCLRKFYHNGDLNRHLRHVHKVNTVISARDNKVTSQQNLTVSF